MTDTLVSTSASERPNAYVIGYASTSITTAEDVSGVVYATSMESGRQFARIDMKDIRRSRTFTIPLLPVKGQDVPDLGFFIIVFRDRSNRTSTDPYVKALDLQTLDQDISSSFKTNRFTDGQTHLHDFVESYIMPPVRSLVQHYDASLPTTDRFK